MMQQGQEWHATPLNLIRRKAPKEAARAAHSAYNNSVLSQWGIPESQRYNVGQENRVPSLLGDAIENMTVWFASVASLAELAKENGINPSRTEFVDVGCGVGLAAVYAVEILDFSLALGIEYDSSRVNEAKGSLQGAIVSTSSKERISLVHADAATYVVPRKETDGRFFFIFNSFGENSLEAFILNNLGEMSPGDVFALCNDVSTLPVLIRMLPNGEWLRNDETNCSLFFLVSRLVWTRWSGAKGEDERGRQDFRSFSSRRGS